MKNLAIGLIIGICIGSAAFWFYNKQPLSKPADSNVSEVDKVTETPTDDSLSNMYYTLEKAESNSEFDRLYLNYLIQIQNNEIGMSRLARQKTTKPELGDIADKSIAKNSELVPQLYSWQKIWGYTHH